MEIENSYGSPFDILKVEDMWKKQTSSQRHEELIEIFGDVTLEELLVELHARGEIRTISVEHVYDLFELDNVRERMKFDAIMEKLEDIPESELDEFLNKY